MPCSQSPDVRTTNTLISGRYSVAHTKERGALVAFLLFAGVLLLTWGVVRVFDQWGDAQNAAEMARRDQTFSVGEWASLDSAEDQLPLPYGGSYEAHFGWEGELDIRVSSADMVSADDPRLNTLDEDTWISEASAEGDSSYLMVELDVRNVSAVPEALTKSGERWFNISFLNIADGTGHLAYFDGSPEDALADLGELMYFDLEQGEEDSYTLLYNVGADTDPSSLALCAGYANLPNKYRFELWG